MSLIMANGRIRGRTLLFDRPPGVAVMRGRRAVPAPRSLAST